MSRCVDTDNWCAGEESLILSIEFPPLWAILIFMIYSTVFHGQNRVAKRRGMTNMLWKQCINLRPTEPGLPMQNLSVDHFLSTSKQHRRFQQCFSISHADSQFGRILWKSTRKLRPLFPGKNRHRPSSSLLCLFSCVPHSKAGMVLFGYGANFPNIFHRVWMLCSWKKKNAAYLISWKKFRRHLYLISKV